MAAISLHTGVMTSPKHTPLSDAAFRLWVHGLCWSKEHLTDGFIPAAVLPSLHRRAEKLVGELLVTVMPGRSPLWRAVEGGYAIHDYAEWQETKSRVQDRRRTWREKKAGQRGMSPRDTHGESRLDSKLDSPQGSGVGSGSGNRSPQPPKGADVPVWFTSFWQEYPNRVGKGAALKAWQKLNPDEATVEAIFSALKWQRRQEAWTKDGGKFIPHPSTWLNARRWEDERPSRAVEKPLPIVDWANV